MSISQKRFKALIDAANDWKQAAEALLLQIQIAAQRRDMAHVERLSTSDITTFLVNAYSTATTLSFEEAHYRRTASFNDYRRRRRRGEDVHLSSYTTLGHESARQLAIYEEWLAQSAKAESMTDELHNGTWRAAEGEEKE